MSKHIPNYSRISKLALTIESIHGVWAAGFLSHEEEEQLISRIWKEIYWEMTGKAWGKEATNVR